MISGYTLDVHIGKRERFGGRVRVSTPDSCGDIEIQHVSESGDEHYIFLRPSEARLLARLLLQVSEEDE